MKVEIWSDLVCPWCYIGKRRFEAAVEEFDGEVEIVWRSFELEPDASTDPKGDLTEALASKYRMSLPQAGAMMDQMTQTAAAEGLEFDFASAQRANTLDAHRLLHFAAEKGLQEPMAERLMRAYFSEGRAIGDPTELAALAGEVGLDPDEVETMLAGPDYVEAVRADEARAASLGIRGVPFFLIDGRLGISGAHPTPKLREILERVGSEV